MNHDPNGKILIVVVILYVLFWKKLRWIFSTSSLAVSQNSSHRPRPGCLWRSVNSCGINFAPKRSMLLFSHEELTADSISDSNHARELMAVLEDEFTKSFHIFWCFAGDCARHLETDIRSSLKHACSTWRMFARPQEVTRGFLVADLPSLLHNLM